jgi:hypothetical protein
MISRLYLTPFAVALWLIIGVNNASAGYEFNLKRVNTTIDDYTGPYVHVDVVRTSSTTATITFTSLSAVTPPSVQPSIYLMGSGGTVGLNINSSDVFSTANVTVTYSNSGLNFEPAELVSINSGNQSGGGVFNLTVNSKAGFKYTSDKVVVNVTSANANWAYDSSVLVVNADGNLASAHVFATSYPADFRNGVLDTGYVWGNHAPAPSSAIAALSGLVIFGLVGFARLRRRPQPVLAV